MPLESDRPSPDRADFHGTVSADEIDLAIGDSSIRVLQTSSPVDLRTARLLNDTLFSRRYDVQFRVYGFYRTACDLSFLSQMGNLRHCAIDLTQSNGLESLAELGNLESLSIGIYDLDTFDFLDRLPKENITKLFLGTTRSKRPTLDHLGRFQNLKVLHLEKQQKGIDVISSLSALEDLTLRSITTQGLPVLKNLPKLWSLDIKLGSIKDLSALEGVNGVKYLELWQIKGLNDISVISTMLGIQFLFLQTLPHIVSLPDLSKLTSLRRIYLDTMKGLKDLSMLLSAPALEELIHNAAAGQPADYETLLRKGSLKKASVGFGNYRKNRVFQELRTRNGVDEYDSSAFSFV